MNLGSTRTQHVAGLMVTLGLVFGIGAADAHEPPKPPPLPHFTCFNLAETGGAINEDVTLITQFDKRKVEVKNPHFLCAPTIKKRFCKTDKYGKETCEEVTRADLDGLHLLCWKIAPSGPPVGQEVTLDSQFGDTDVKVQTAQLLCEPVMKEVKSPPK